jgi:hypothetical protein
VLSASGCVSGTGDTTFSDYATEGGKRMGIGVSLILIAIGAILIWATTLNTIGWIVLAVGALGIVLSLIFWSSWGGMGRRETTVIEERRY